MTEQTIVTRTGGVVSGRIVDHRGGGVVEIEADGKRFVGTKVKPHTTSRATASAQ